jgi:L-aminopeptidase/D-esterase-like protein
VARPRARDLGVPFDGTPGPLDAITDVAGVEVGHATIVRGDGALVVGEGPVRTGVTAVLPRGRDRTEPCFAGWSTLNGNGEMTGTTWLAESGFLEGPVLITNTHSVGVVRDAVIAWRRERGAALLQQPWSLPVVAETYDGWLNDIDGHHVKPEHAHAALDGARSGPVDEGNVGGGTGMICHEFKGGIGTASRIVDGFTVGALVQANYGRREQLRVAGIPVGAEIGGDLVYPRRAETGDGSIIVVLATDAPLLPNQCERLSRRAGLGIARMGGIGANSSGDIFVAFSTANESAGTATSTAQVTMLANDRLSALFGAAVEVTEEAITNALVAAETMVGRDGHRVAALPHDGLRDVLRRHGRLAAT